METTGGRRWWWRTGVVLLSVLLTLVAAEGLLRVFGYSYRLYPEKIEFGYPDAQTMASRFVEDPDLLWVTHDYESQQQALRANPPSLVFMGCSCTAHGGYAREFERRLRAGGPVSRPLANFGIEGWSTYQGVQQLERDVVPLRPAVVTIFYGWNDHWVGIGVTDEQAAAIKSSALLKWQDLRLVQLVSRGYIGATGIGGELPRRVSLPDFEENLRRMVAAARDAAIVPVLVTAPTSHQRGKEPEYLAERWMTKLEDLVPLHQRYVAAVRRVAEEEGVILCDLAAEFDRIDRDDVGRYFFRDGIHFDPPGDEHVGRLLFECFAEHGLLDRLR